jgi:hypothetical protein
MANFVELKLLVAVFSAAVPSCARGADGVGVTA